MTQINIHEAKTKFSQLVERALDGEEIVIARYGKPLLRLVPMTSATGKRASGLNILKSKDVDWFAPMTESELSKWYNSPTQPAIKASKAVKRTNSKT